MFGTRKTSVAGEASFVLLSVTQSNFAELSALLPPERLIGLMNANFAACEDEIHGREGHVVRVIGDCLTGAWFAEEKLFEKHICADVSESILRRFRENAARLTNDLSLRPAHVLSWAAGVCVFKETQGRIEDVMGDPMFRVRAIGASHRRESKDVILLDEAISRAWNEGALVSIGSGVLQVKTRG